jgi:hypothetical protein
MRYAGISVLAILTGILCWMGLVRQPLPPVPEISRTLSKEVPFEFSIKSMNYKSVEFGLNKQAKGKDMFIQFSMANAWKTGRPGLVLNGINARSNFSGGMSAQKYLDDSKRKGKESKDFSDFMKDKSGKSVSTYRFKQTLVEGKGGETFMLIAYDGPAMEMIQTLEVPRPVTLPAHISQLFVDKGIIQFQPGTVAFDNRNQGFYIPVKVR